MMPLQPSTSIFCLLYALSHICFSYAIYDCPYPICASCRPAAIHDAPGIGFDLSVSYGVSVIHHIDGSIENLAKVPAQPEYLELIERLSKSPKPKPSKYRDYVRWLNKKWGRPATPDVGILSRLVLDLKHATETMLSKPIGLVVATAPLFQALSDEDINDAMEYAGVHHWLSDPNAYVRRIGEGNAIFAAYGNGLCENYKNLYECWDEDYYMPRHKVLTVLFTRHALFLTLDTLDHAFQSWGSEAISIDFSAGLDGLSSYPSASTFWIHVYDRLVSLYASAYSQSNLDNWLTPLTITKVLLAGDSVTEPQFLHVLRDALAHILGPHAPLKPIWHFVSGTTYESNVTLSAVVDPVYAAARGAAHFARWRQEAPWGCEEYRRCDEERRKGEGQHRVELK